MSINANDIQSVTKSVTRKWTKQRKAEDRGKSRASRAYMHSDRVNFTDIAAKIIPAAYMHASGNGSLPAAKRQIYYACREAFRVQTGRELEYRYFANTLLVQYMNRNPETATWKVTADPRGTLLVPNSSHEVHVPVGTLQIDRHLGAGSVPHTYKDLEEDAKVDIEWPSVAPGQRYQAVLYIEKEGFGPLLKDAQIAEKFDLAIISCKGQSVVAARKFVDETCYVGGGVPLYVVHDFDKAGFEISQRLTNVSHWAEENDRVTYHFRNQIDVTDLGLRLADVEEYSLPVERCRFKGGFAADSICTEEERDFLRSGQRVELNAFTSPQFIEWLQAKLDEQGLTRMIPSEDDILVESYKRAIVVAHLNKAIDAAWDRAEQKVKDQTVPKTLRRQLRNHMKDNPDQAWDKALYALVESKVSDES